MKLLALESGGPRCSACVWCDGTLIERHTDEPRAHASHVLSLIEAALAAAGIGLGQIDKLAFGEGPGALTGLRVAASVVQGFALVTECPIVAVSNLQALALRVSRAAVATSPLLVAHDLGMGSVCWQRFDPRADGGVAPSNEASLDTPDAVRWPTGAVRVAGSGAALLDAPAGTAVTVHPAQWASAADVAEVAARGGGRAVAVQAAQPVYWRHPVYN